LNPRRKGRGQYKWLIFRRLTPFLTFLGPFLSQKGLVSRRLHGFARKFFLEAMTNSKVKMNLENQKRTETEMHPMHMMTFNIITLDGRAVNR
jgi:hypothetical protein